LHPVRVLRIALTAALLCACDRQPEHERPAPTQASSTTPSTAPSQPPPDPPQDTRNPAFVKRQECARVTRTVNDGARALADLEGQRHTMRPEQYLDTVARELDKVGGELERMKLETPELSAFARDYAKTLRQAGEVARGAGLAAGSGRTERLARAEADMAAAMQKTQPLLDATTRFCNR